MLHYDLIDPNNNYFPITLIKLKFLITRSEKENSCKETYSNYILNTYYFITNEVSYITTMQCIGFNPAQSKWTSVVYKKKYQLLKPGSKLNIIGKMS